MEKKDFIKEINFLNSYSKTTSEIIDIKYINDTNININTKKDSYINKTSYDSIGNIIPDAYIKIRKEKKVKRVLLEVQISPNDCLTKYKEIKDIIIENTKWPVMPTLYIVNNQGLNKKLKNIKVIYDNCKIEKVGDLYD